MNHSLVYFIYYSVLNLEWYVINSVQSLSRVWLCNSKDYSMSSFPVHHQLSEFAQTHLHQVGDAIQPCHPLLSASPPAFSLSQHQGLFQWVSSSHQVAKVLQLQHQFLPMNIQGWFPLAGTGLSPCSPRHSQDSYPTPQFKSINYSAFSFLYTPTLISMHHYWKNYNFD